MLPLLATKTLFSNLPWLTIAKISVIIALMGATSYLTWQVAQNDINKERLVIVEKQLQAEKSTTEYWMSQVNRASEIASKAAAESRKLDIQVNAILKDHKNAPSLPPNCVIDANGVLSLEAARNAAIKAANSSPPNIPSN